MAIKSEFINPLSNMSYVNKDFQTIYPELLDLAKKISYKWDPSISDESDPGVVLLKLCAIIADKNNYNIDSNVLECFPISVSQDGNARPLFEQLGYSMRWYRAGTATMQLKWIGETSDSLSYDIPIFTMVSDNETTVVYTLTSPVKLPLNGEVQTTSALQGTVNKYSINGVSLITSANLDSNNRLYFTSLNVAENGIFINNNGIENYSDWSRVDNLSVEEYGKKVYKFGVTRDGTSCYIEFPDDIEDLIGDGIYITYITTSGSDGNVASGVIEKFYNEVTVTSSDDSTSTVTLTADNVKIANVSAVQNGYFPEDIEDAYKNYKKTIGTFNTLVTRHDYENYISSLDKVSNCVVSDRTTDIQASYHIMSESDSVDRRILQVEKNLIGSLQLNADEETMGASPAYIEHLGEISADSQEDLDDALADSADSLEIVNASYIQGEPGDVPANADPALMAFSGDKVDYYSNKMDPFDLKLYALQWVDIISTASAYNNSFAILPYSTAQESLYTTEDEIVDSEYGDLAEVKCIQHNFKRHEADRICILKNKYPIIAKIIPQYRLTDLQREEVETNIRKALYEKLNAKEVPFGEEISYSDVFDIISEADERIKSVALDTLEYTTFAVYFDSTGGTYKEVAISDNFADYYKKITDDEINNVSGSYDTSLYYLNTSVKDDVSSTDAGGLYGYYKNTVYTYNKTLNCFILYSDKINDFRLEIYAKSVLNGNTQLLVPSEISSVNIDQFSDGLYYQVEKMSTEVEADVINKSDTEEVDIAVSDADRHIIFRGATSVSQRIVNDKFKVAFTNSLEQSAYDDYLEDSSGTIYINDSSKGTIDKTVFESNTSYVEGTIYLIGESGVIAGKNVLVGNLLKAINNCSGTFSNDDWEPINGSGTNAYSLYNNIKLSSAGTLYDLNSSLGNVHKDTFESLTLYKNGDTYLVGEAGTYADIPVTTGDILLAINSCDGDFSSDDWVVLSNMRSGYDAGYLWGISYSNNPTEISGAVDLSTGSFVFKFEEDSEYVYEEIGCTVTYSTYIEMNATTPGSYSVRENESIQLFAPSMISAETFGNYVKYQFKLNKNAVPSYSVISTVNVTSVTFGELDNWFNNDGNNLPGYYDFQKSLLTNRWSVIYYSNYQAYQLRSESDIDSRWIGYFTFDEDITSQSIRESFGITEIITNTSLAGNDPQFLILLSSVDATVDRVVRANTEYRLQNGESITFYWKEEEDAIYSYKKYVEGDIISPTFTLSSANNSEDVYDSTRSAYTSYYVGDHLTAKSGYVPDETVDFYINNTPHTYTYNDYVSTLLKDKYVLSGTNTISERVTNTVNVGNSSNKCYWITNSLNDKEQYILFETNKTEYILKTGEYFLYTNKSETSLLLLGEGTKLVRTGINGATTASYVEWACDPLNYDDIVSDGVTALTDYWFTIPTIMKLEATEMRYYALNSNTVFRLIPNNSVVCDYVRFSNSGYMVYGTCDGQPDTEMSGVSLADFTIQYKDEDSTTFTAIPTLDIGASGNWTGYSIYSIDMSSDYPQSVYGHQKIVLEDSTGVDHDIIGNDTFTYYVESDKTLSKTGGEDVSVVTYDTSDNKVPATIYVYRSSVDERNVNVSYYDDYSTIKLINDSADISTISETVSCNFPEGNYIIPVRHTSTFVNQMTVLINGVRQSCINNKGGTDFSTPGTYYIKYKVENGVTKLDIEVSAEITASKTATIYIDKVYKYEKVYNDVDDTVDITESDFEKILTKIVQLDVNYKYNYTYVVDTDEEIKYPLLSDSFFDANHIFNKFVIGQLDTSKTDVYITNKIK